jgi:group I intron endonuclease
MKSTAFRFPGIYVITNTINGNQYVGSAKDIYVRWRIHKSNLKYQIHHSTHLQRAWEKYGANAFTFAVIERVDDLSILIAREQHYIDTMCPVYNTARIAGNTLGIPCSPEKRANISAARIRNMTEEKRQRLRDAAQHRSEEWRENVRAAMRTPEMREMLRQRMLGKPKTPEQIEKHRIAITGRIPSDETRAKLSAAGMGRKRTPETQAKIAETRESIKQERGRYFSDEAMARIKAGQERRRERERAEGFVVSEETRQKISEAGKGRPGYVRTEEWRQDRRERMIAHFAQPGTREKISEALKGKHPSEETRKKLSEVRKGMKRPPRSEEWRKRQSEAQARVHAEKRTQKQQQLQDEQRE